MDKDKLKKWLRMNAVKPFVVNAKDNVIKHNDLVSAINNGKFNKEPCEYCGEDYKKDYYFDDKYCSNCGRKLGVR
jgi:predicted amidophosphoribosyltransferase